MKRIVKLVLRLATNWLLGFNTVQPALGIEEYKVVYEGMPRVENVVKHGGVRFSEVYKKISVNHLTAVGNRVILKE